jgi:hypothetical protein
VSAISPAAFSSSTFFYKPLEIFDVSPMNGTAAAIMAIDLLDLLAPAVWRGAGETAASIPFLAKLLLGDSARRWSPGGGPTQRATGLSTSMSAKFCS